ncbi:MAG: DUF362 domain-containing protein [Lachnospiraceae bacterium]|nr:DUF362 domain-containing protein [Lachnospiraceae bacterium]
MKQNEIIKIYGTDYKEMTKLLLERADLASEIPSPESLIGIKPNLVTPTPAEYGATTHPEIVAGIIEYLREHGFPRMVILESSWVGDVTAEAFECCGYNTLSEHYGVELWDLQKDSSHFVDCGSRYPGSEHGESGHAAFRAGDCRGQRIGSGRGESGHAVSRAGNSRTEEILGTASSDHAVSRAGDSESMRLRVCDRVDEIDFLINVPVLKGHCQTKITCALKNSKGLIPNSEKRRFHTMGLHRPIAYLGAVIHQDFIVVDHICGDLDFEEGGHPVVRNCIMAAKDPVLTDALVCRMLQYDISEVPYVGMAEALGAGRADPDAAHITTIERPEIADSGMAEEEKPDEPEGLRRHKVCDVQYAVEEVDACSACYAMLVPALDRLREEGLLEKLREKIAIGQGYRGKQGKLGVGLCTSGFEYCIRGCPPSEEQIYKELVMYIESAENA